MAYRRLIDVGTTLCVYRDTKITSDFLYVRRAPSCIQDDSRRKICDEDKPGYFRSFAPGTKLEQIGQQSKIGHGGRTSQTKHQANVNESRSAYHEVLAIKRCQKKMQYHCIQN